MERSRLYSWDYTHELGTREVAETRYASGFPVIRPLLVLADTQSTAEAATHWVALKVLSLRNTLLAFAHTDSSTLMSFHPSGSARISTDETSVHRQRG